MAGSLLGIRNTWADVNGPRDLFSYYQGASIVGIGVHGGSIPTSGPISILDFDEASTSTVYSYNQHVSIPGLPVDQPNLGCAWAVEYLKGSSGFGLYVTVAYYGDGGRISYSSWGNYSYVSQFKITTFNTNVSGTTVHGNTQGESYYLGVPYGNINSSTNILKVYGNNGQDSPGDTGYAYATAYNRLNWSAMTGGNNYFQVQLG
jgi:hypothetical protein